MLRRSLKWLIAAEWLAAIAIILLTASPQIRRDVFEPSAAYAATISNSIIAAQTPSLGLAQFLQGTDAAGAYKTVYVGGANGSKIIGLYVNSNDGSASHLVTCQVKRGATLFGGAAISATISSGFANTVPPVSVMTATVWPGLPVDGSGNPYLFLASGDLLQCTYTTALTAGMLINVHAIGADF